MHPFSVPMEELTVPPPHLFERLAQIPGYIWDHSIDPFHSSYDNWHVFGVRHLQNESLPVTHTASDTSDIGRFGSTRNSPRLTARLALKNENSGSETESNVSSMRRASGTIIPVIARVSTHSLRLEREYHVTKSLKQTSDPNSVHTLVQIEFVRLPAQQGDGEPLVVSIFQSPGPNHLKELVNFGPAWYISPNQPTSPRDSISSSTYSPGEHISLPIFLDFAIGASECLELLHHRQNTVHGEIRADAFHFNQETGAVKLINFGSGRRSFENGLTSAGWSSLSKELGVKNKLQFIAPEQTGRMPAEPDSRTDIYSLGVLFWSMLTREPAFDGDTPMDIVQSTLNRRLPPVSSKRMDIPDILSSVIQRMTQKQIDERYHSVSGLKHDLTEIHKMLGNGDGEALKNFVIGSRDVSSFFVLPASLFGRQEQHEKILKVVERVSKRQRSATTQDHGYGMGSSTSVSTENLELADATSDASSRGGRGSRTNSAANAVNYILSPNPDQGFQDPAQHSPVTSKLALHKDDSRDSIATRASVTNLDTATTRSSGPDGQLNDGLAHPARRRNSQKFRRRERCEVITISGGAGLGKSSLVQSVQPFIRKLGYFASAKFDKARQAPFEPVLRVMSSLFRQIFAESDVATDYHNIIRANVRPIWGTLHGMLDLPEQLISMGDVQVSSNQSSTAMSRQGLNRSLKAELRDSSSTHSSMSTNSAGQTTADFLRGGSSSKSLRFMNIFLEVLRVLSRNKLLCLCLDDLQFADEESLQLLSNIVSGKLGVVLMVTYRQEGLLPANVKAVLETETASTTRIELPPLSEDDVVAFVATTLYRPREYVFPLAAVCLERSMGNPFYLREMLQTCYRSNCLWYSWKHSQWEFDLDRVFSEFETETYGQTLDNSFVTRRLEELPADTRSILAWAALLGNEFSFGLVTRLLSGEFNLDNSDGRDSNDPTKTDTFAQETDAVAGLQAALQSYILVPGEEEDVFRMDMVSFSHDRYIQAAASLTECRNIEKMHFIIAQTLMKYSSLDERSLYDRARHICHAIETIKQKIPHRSRYRELLLQAAQKATEAGARPTALEYFTKCLALLQQNPWEEEAPDVYYEETLLLYTKSAEILWYQGDSDMAIALLQSVFANARNAADKASSWILQSRIFAQRGDSEEAIGSLKSSLSELGVEIQTLSWEECDKEYKMLRQQLQSMDRDELLGRPASVDQNTIAMGSVLLETKSVSFWSDALLFYQMSLATIQIYLSKGTNVQTGLEYMHLAMVSIGRFGEIPFGLEMYSICQALLEQYGEMSNIARGSSIGTLFVAHLQSPIREHIPVLDEALEYSSGSGDRLLSLVCIGATALIRLSTGENMATLEIYCEYAPEEFPGWENDLRWGNLIVAIRQVARSLGGKTSFRSAAHVMADEKHNSQEYLNDILNRSPTAERSSDIYNSLHLIPLYLFGHYPKAIEIGITLLGNLHELWTMRNGRMTLFYLSLAVLAELRETAISDDKEALLETVRGYTKQIEEWQAVCDANYAMWSLLLTAEVMELEGNMHGSIQAYEAAIDHTQVHGFTLEEALAFELHGEFLVRRGARRAARSVIQDAIAAWTRISAFGKAEQLTEKHDWLMNTSTDVRTADAGCQTIPSDLRDVGNTQNCVEENERAEHRKEGTETRHDRTEAWLYPLGATGASVKAEAGVSDLGLDVLDLQSIIEFSQVISSELHIDRLLVKMTEIILESAGIADFGAIITEAPDVGWAIAASGSQDNVEAYPEGLPFEDAQDQVAKHVIFYTLRFRETVFVENILRDERFSNVSEQYMLKHPQGKAVIALPILQSETLLGVLYLEGPAKCFTRKTLVVLQLLCNQLGISIANALLFKRLRKVSASNTSMIDTQRRALAQAREAEAKAKIAETEAMRNVRLKEEAAKAKSMFLANVSHELRTPLNGVIGMSELLKGTPLNKEQEGYADSIRLCADTLLTVINDILDFSKLEAGKMKMFRVPLNLHETISEVVRALKYSHRERGLETIEDLQLDRNLLVMGDPVRLHQVFMNLLSNSYKFTAKGSVTIRAITDSQTRDSITVTCSVSDTGIGISKEQLSKLFKPFSQADNSTARSYGGSGLGLSICKAMIENVMYGKIWLKSKPGVGTTVFFTLSFPKAPKDVPVDSMQITAKDPDPMANWESNVETNGSLTPTLSNFNDLSLVPRNELRICIAEDNPVNQKIAVSFVKKLGFNPEAYSDGKQAVDALRRRSKEGRHFHLVLMDVQMPVLDGYEATRTIRKDEDPAVRGVLIIAMTASAIRGDREKCIDAGMNNYLAKPVRAAVLKAMLEEYLSQPPKEIPRLQEAATELAEKVVKEVEQHTNSEEVEVNGTSPETSKDSETSITPRNEHISQDPFATLNDQPSHDENLPDQQG